MRASQRLLPESTAMESVIQDVQIPFEHAEDFFNFILEEDRYYAGLGMPIQDFGSLL